MQTKNAWWITLISAGMVVYGVAATWSTVVRDQNQNVLGCLIYCLLACLVPGAIAVVGAISFVSDIRREPGDDSPHALASSLEPFVLAWHRLWGTKWLLWVFGGVAAAGVVGNLVNDGIQVWFDSMRFPDKYGGTSYLTPLEEFIQLLWSGLPNWVHGELDRFVPRISVNWTPPVVAIAALLLLIWVLPRLSRVARDIEYPGEASFIGACLVLLLVVCIAASVFWFLEMSSFVATLSPPAAPTAAPTAPAAASLAHATAVEIPTGTSAGRRHLPPWYLGLGGIIMAAIFNAILMGGILGSLARSRRGENDVKTTFLGDAVRYFEPLAGIYLVFWLLSMSSSLLWGLSPSVLQGIVGWLPISWLAVLLMFAPMGVVTQGLGFSAAVRHSLQVWKDNAWRTIWLIATGAFLAGLVMGLRYTIQDAIRTIQEAVQLSQSRNSLPQMLTGLVFTIVGVAVTALIILAVWEFYSAQVLERQDAVQEMR